MNKASFSSLTPLLDQLNQVVVGKPDAVLDSLTCVLAGGHLLIEDVPGVGKTTLARSLAVSLGLRFSRVQFTADLMPSDLIGVSVYERSQEAFVFHPGPLFTEVLLADEINRAGPKTQSALLEAMEEHQISAEGQTHTLDAPFIVIATQNPTDQLGTYGLPESQLDRFLMCIHLGYPDRQAERALLTAPPRQHLLARMGAVLEKSTLLALQQQVQTIHAAAPVLDYLQDVVEATRNGQWCVQGLSTRASLGVLRAAQARALIAQRDYVIPEDIQAIWVQVAAHRLVPLASAGRGRVDQAQALLASVALR